MPIIHSPPPPLPGPARERERRRKKEAQKSPRNVKKHKKHRINISDTQQREGVSRSQWHTSSPKNLNEKDSKHPFYLSLSLVCEEIGR